MDKKRVVARVSDDVKEQLKNHVETFKKKYVSENDFLTAAIKNQMALDNLENTDLISQKMLSVIKEHNAELENRIASSFYSLAIAVDMVFSFLETESNYTRTEVEMMRVDSIERMKQTKKIPDFRNFLKED